jgi:hypothetical protein
MRETDKRATLHSAIKPALWLALIIFLGLQIPVLLGADGLLARHGFWGGFDAFKVIMLSDPITVAGLIDLVALMLFAIVIFIEGVPRGRGYWPKLIALIVALIVYPGLAVIAFLLLYWRQKGQFRPGEPTQNQGQGNAK